MAVIRTGARAGEEELQQARGLGRLVLQVVRAQRRPRRGENPPTKQGKAGTGTNQGKARPARQGPNARRAIKGTEVPPVIQPNQ